MKRVYGIDSKQPGWAIKLRQTGFIPLGHIPGMQYGGRKKKQPRYPDTWSLALVPV